MPTKRDFSIPTAFEAKAAHTNTAARLIINAETQARTDKIRLLRMARLEHEVSRLGLETKVPRSKQSNCLS